MCPSGRYSGRSPLAHQKLTANFKVLNAKAFDLSDMGTMKTLSTLWAADYLMTKLKCRTIIVCPRSIMQLVWGNEIFGNLIGRRTFELIQGPPEKRRKLLQSSADFYIINYDGLKIGAEKKRRNWHFSGLAGDIAELQYAEA